MLQEFEDKIGFVRLPNIESTDIRRNTPKLSDEEKCQHKELTFANFAEVWLSNFEITDEKSEVAAYIPARFKPDEEMVKNDRQSYRLDANIDEITILVLDLDDPEAINNAKRIFKDHEYVIHSTHSRTKTDPHKFRMLIKLEHPIPQQEWKAFVYKIIVPIGADPSCSNPSRGFYLPSYIDPSNPDNFDKYIEPVSEYHPGIALTLEFADKIAKDYQNELRKANNSEGLKNYLWKISDKTQIEGKRHPAGGIVKDNVVHSQVDTSYEAYVKRHMKSIKEHLVDGRRHNFALSTIMREFQKYRDMVDVNSLVMFLYKASEEYNDSYLYMEGTPSEDRGMYKKAEDFFTLRGQRSLRDTPNELEEMITSAIRNTSNMTKPVEHFTSRLDAALKSAEIASQTNNWLFRKPKRPGSNVSKKSELELCLSECKPAIEGFKKQRSWNKFVHDMLDDLVADTSMDNETKTKEVRFRCQAILKTVDDFYKDNQSTLKRGINADSFNNQLIEIASEVAGKDRALKLSILTGFESYKKHMTQLEPKTGKSPHP